MRVPYRVNYAQAVPYPASPMMYDYDDSFFFTIMTLLHFRFSEVTTVATDAKSKFNINHILIDVIRMHYTHVYIRKCIHSYIHVHVQE